MTSMISYDSEDLLNPFTPEAGVSPPVLLDREQVLKPVERGLAMRRGKYSRILVQGERAVGKTVLLNEVEALAKARQWLVVSETAVDEDLILNIYNALVRYLQAVPEADNREFESHVTSFGLSVTGFTLGREVKDVTREDLRLIIGLVGSWLDKNKTGLLISIDEVQGLLGAPQAVAKLSVISQHARREGLPVFFICAGLPEPISRLLEIETTSFLNRAEKVLLNRRIPAAEIRDSYNELFKAGGYALSPDLLDEMTELTEGLPYGVQLVGYNVWEAIEAGLNLDDAAEIRDLLQKTRAEMAQDVWSAVWRDLRKAERLRQVLKAMAESDGPVRTSNIAAVIQVPMTSMSQFRDRLIKLEAIVSTKQGWIDFASPQLRAFVRQQAE